MDGGAIDGCWIEDAWKMSRWRIDAGQTKRETQEDLQTWKVLLALLSENVTVEYQHILSPALC